MSFAKFVESQLPDLRRYAFAVLNDAAQADYCVELVLIDLLEERSLAGAASQPMRRLDLFARLQSYLQKSSAAKEPSLSRQLFLLLEMEQFSIDKVSLILGEPLEDMWRLVNSKEYAIARATYAKRGFG